MLAYLVVCMGLAFFINESHPEWRNTYDIILLWINFAVLVILFVKFAKKPIAEAMRGVAEKIAEELAHIKNQLNKKKTDLEAEETKIKEIHGYLEEIKAQIITMGEKEKSKIVEQAKEAADKMVSDAKLYADLQMERAKKQLSDELVDIAVNTVEDRLTKEITKEDNDKLISDFLISLEGTKPHLN